MEHEQRDLKIWMNLDLSTLGVFWYFKWFVVGYDYWDLSINILWHSFHLSLSEIFLLHNRHPPIQQHLVGAVRRVSPGIKRIHVSVPTLWRNRTAAPQPPPSMSEEARPPVSSLGVSVKEAVWRLISGFTLWSPSSVTNVGGVFASIHLGRIIKAFTLKNEVWPVSLWSKALAWIVFASSHSN